MQPVLSHPWDLCEEEASALQTTLAGLVVTEDRLPAHINTVAGVDVAYEDQGTRAFAAVAVFDVVNGKLGQIVSAEAKSRFPYSPGLLSFREVPVLAAAFEKLSKRPDLVICDGQGIAHPRRLGIAAHLGILLDIRRMRTHSGDLSGLNLIHVADRDILGKNLRRHGQGTGRAAGARDFGVPGA